MNLKNLELPVLRFKSEMDERRENIDTHNMISSLMEQIVNYTDLIGTIRRAELPEDWEDIKDAFTSQNAYNPVDYLWILREVFNTLHAAHNLYASIEAETERTKIAETQCKELRQNLNATLQLLDSERKTEERAERIAEIGTLLDQRQKIIENMEKQVAEQ